MDFNGPYYYYCTINDDIVVTINEDLVVHIEKPDEKYIFKTTEIDAKTQELKYNLGFNDVEIQYFSKFIKNNFPLLVETVNDRGIA
ncbi:MAG: hypothetical protein LBM02_08515 [Lachnospiraceae bacterium]|jgi:hypothetical protein|nr:hypothetical protein [Lachnospiraceae bacterium]